MTRKPDWRWVSRDDGMTQVAVWEADARPQQCDGSSCGRHFCGISLWRASADDFALLGARIQPGQCKRVRITLEVLPDE